MCSKSIITGRVDGFPFSVNRCILKNMKTYPVKEELLNSITHGLGIFFGTVALTILCLKASYFGTTTHLWSYIIYGVSMILLYTSSTLYHAIPCERAKRILKVCDHSSIYLLIAGTYTPFLMLNLKSELGMGLMGLIWTLAVTGIIFKFFFTGRFKLLSTLLYIGMGWIIVFAIGPLSEAVSRQAIIYLFAGGLAYTLGTIFYMAKRMPYAHAVWHLFVLTGSLFHFLAIISSANFSS